jgi:hypothetical protein
MLQSRCAGGKLLGCSPDCCLSRPAALYSPALEVPAPIDTLTELRQLAYDLTELGDTATAVLVRQAIDRFSARRFEAGEELLARAWRSGVSTNKSRPGRLTSMRARWRWRDRLKLGGG